MHVKFGLINVIYLINQIKTNKYYSNPNRSILPNTIQYHIFQYILVPCNAILCHLRSHNIINRYKPKTIQYHSIQEKIMKLYQIQSNCPIPSNIIKYNTIPFNIICYQTIYGPISSNTILYHPVTCTLWNNMWRNLWGKQSSTTSLRGGSQKMRTQAWTQELETEPYSSLSQPERDFTRSPPSQPWPNLQTHWQHTLDIFVVSNQPVCCHRVHYCSGSNTAESLLYPVTLFKVC